MKKIFSFILAVLMITCLSATSFAAVTTTTVSVVGDSFKASDLETNNVIDVAIDVEFPEPTGLLGFAVNLNYDKEMFDLVTWEMTGDITWSTANSNENKDPNYAFLFFEDTNFMGTTPAEKYTITAKFNVLDVTALGEYDFSISLCEYTDANWIFNDTYAIGLENLKSGKISIISDEPAADTVAMAAAPVFTADAVESTQDEGWQKGQAVINTFKLGDIKNFINMGWKLSFVDETYADRYATLGEDKFAQIIEDLGSVDDTADVEFVAAFVVNERDAEGNVIDHIIKAVETALYDGSKVFTAVAPAAN